MKTDLTEIACIIDRSGSMQSIATDAIGGFNSFLENQKTHSGQASFTLVLFNHDYEVIYESCDIHTVKMLDATTYIPNGTTALLDAVGRTIDDLGMRLYNTPEYERPGKVIVAILTDGVENVSKDYTLDRVSERIKHQQEKYRWEFLFLAANQDAIAAATEMSIQSKNAINFDATGTGVREVYGRLDKEVKCFREG